MAAGTWGVQLLADVITYNAAISACGKSEQWQQTSGLWAETRNMNVLPSVITYNVQSVPVRSMFSGSRHLASWRISLT